MERASVDVYMTEGKNNPVTKRYWNICLKGDGVLRMLYYLPILMKKDLSYQGKNEQSY